jgi:hypothetical protein
MDGVRVRSLSGAKFSFSGCSVYCTLLWSSSSLTPSLSYRNQNRQYRLTCFNNLNIPASFLMTNNLQMRFLKLPNAKLTDFLHWTPKSFLPFKPNSTVSTTVFSLFCPVQHTIHKISVISHTRKKHISAEARPGLSVYCTVDFWVQRWVSLFSP